MEKVYENIKRRRKMLDMSQQELADKTGYERSSIARIEKGEIDISLGRLSAIAEALDTTVGNLLDYLWEDESK